jgi:hypothetical protein
MYTELLIPYRECGRNAREDAREYAIRFPHLNYTVGKSYSRHWLLARWCLHDKKLVVPRENRTPETEDAVLQSFDDDGRRSIFEELYLPRTYQY